MKTITRASGNPAVEAKRQKPSTKGGLRPSFEPGLGEPGCKLGDFGFSHGAIITVREAAANAGRRLRLSFGRRNGGARRLAEDARAFGPSAGL